MGGYFDHLMDVAQRNEEIQLPTLSMVNESYAMHFHLHESEIHGYAE